MDAIVFDMCSEETCFPSAIASHSIRGGTGPVAVEVVEVGNDDRYWQCNRQYTSNDAQSTDQFAPYADRRDVTVTDRCHGNDCPPERARYGSELKIATNTSN